MGNIPTGLGQFGGRHSAGAVELSQDLDRLRDVSSVIPSAVLDPLFNLRDRVVRERRVAGRHLCPVGGSPQLSQQQAHGRIVGIDDRAVVATAEKSGEAVKIQTGAGLIPSVADEAVLDEQRRDVAGKANGIVVSGGEHGDGRGCLCAARRRQIGAGVLAVEARPAVNPGGEHFDFTGRQLAVVGRHRAGGDHFDQAALATGAGDDDRSVVATGGQCGVGPHGKARSRPPDVTTAASFEQQRHDVGDETGGGGRVVKWGQFNPT